MGYMKKLYTELQETGWKAEEIKQIPDNLAWKMADSNKVREKIKKLKEAGFSIEVLKLAKLKDEK